MRGRGKLGHRHSTKTQRNKIFPERFQKAIDFICENIGKEEYDLALIEDKITLKTMVKHLMDIPNINRDWLQKLSKKIG
jgi:hypothetical protein